MAKTKSKKTTEKVENAETTPKVEKVKKEVYTVLADTQKKGFWNVIKNNEKRVYRAKTKQKAVNLAKSWNEKINR